MPTGVSVQTTENGAIVSWVHLIEATSYNIYFASSPGVTKSNYLALPDGARITDASFPLSITGLTNGTVYYFVVTAVNSLGESEESTEVRPSLPSAPTGISAQPISLGVTISWDPIMVGASYNIYYASSPGITKSNYSTLPNGNRFSGASSPQPLFVSTHEDYFFVVTSTNTGGESVESVEVMAPPGPSLSFDIKTFRFDWLQVSNATHYKLLENPDGISGFSQVGSDIPQGTYTFDHIVALFNRINASYILQSCVGANCDDFGILNITDNLVDAMAKGQKGSISTKGVKS
ncbi:MAG: fibronectin type III domain-containing protein [Gammaproteobacteria bacterium]|nr:fibronectin type III domain-containing protein [Gammaproteobacteria bacterium]